jgi:hypothetical protein
MLNLGAQFKQQKSAVKDSTPVTQASSQGEYPLYRLKMKTIIDGFFQLLSSHHFVLKAHFSYELLFFFICFHVADDFIISSCFSLFVFMLQMILLGISRIHALPL